MEKGKKEKISDWRKAMFFVRRDLRGQKGRTIFLATVFMAAAVISFLFIGELFVYRDDRITKKYDTSAYLQQNDKTMADMFSSIKAVILSSADISKEESIYYETNDNQRVISSFERVLQSDPAVLNFDSEENRRKFIHDVYGNNDPGKIRYTKKDKALWVLALIKKKNPSCEITLKTVQNMLAFIEASSKELIQGILNGIIPLRDGRYLANLTFTEQKEAVESAGTDKYKALLSKAMNGNKKQAVSPDTEKKYLSISRSLIKAGKDFAEIADTLDSKTMNGNQREYLKQIKAVIREISKLEEMPVK